MLKKAFAVTLVLASVFFVFYYYDYLMGFLQPRLDPDFEISASPSLVNLHSWDGSSSGTIITLRSIDGFSQSITLEITPVYLVGDIHLTLDPVSVNLPAYGQAQSALSLYVSSLIPPGRYDVDVVGVSGNLRHSVRVTIVVSY